MTLLNLVIYALWIFPIVLQAAIVFGMVRRKLVKSFPFFFGYTVVVLSGDITTLFFKSNTNSYALIYFCVEVLAVLFGFTVIFEILRHILPRSSSPRFVLNLVWVLAGLFAVTASLMLVLAKPTTGNYSAIEVVLLAERSVRFLQASLLIVVIALMSVLGLTWHYEALGILVGFGAYSAVALVAFECGALHWMSHTAFSILNSAGYNLAALIWAFGILHPRRRNPLDRLPNTDLTEWNSALNNYVSQRTRR